MGLIARLFDFTAATLLKSADVNAEFDQLVNVLNGTNTANRISVQSKTNTTLITDQFSAGPLFQAKRNEVLKVSVENTGQLKSHIATGTAPIDISNSSLVANLNADMIDGVHSAGFLGINSKLTTESQNFFLGIPAIGTIKRLAIMGTRIIKLKAQQQDVGALDGITVIKFIADNTALTILGTITLNANGTQIYTVATDVSTAGIDRIQAKIETQFGVNKHSDITVAVVFDQAPVAAA